MSKRNPYPPDTIPHLLYSRAVHTPRDIAYSFPELHQHGSWSDIWRGVRTLAGGYLRLGVKPGDRIAMLMTGRLELVMTMFAAACVGAVAVPLNAYSKKDELRAYLQASKPVVLLLGAEGHGLQYPAVMLELMREASAPAGTGFLPQHIIVLDDAASVPAPMLPYAELEALGRATPADELDASAAWLSPDEPVVLLFTSGTVGIPKAVLRTTASFFTSPEHGHEPKIASGRSWLTGTVDRIARKFPMLSLLPLYHMGGFGTLLANLKVCNIRLFLLRHYSPANALAVLERERIRLLSGTPYMIQRLLTAPQRERHDLSALLGVAFTSAAVDRSVIRRVINELNLAFFLVSYGSSEAGAVANGVCLTERQGNMLLTLLIRGVTRLGLLSGCIPLEAFEQNPYSLAGKPDRGVDVRIVDPVSLAPLPPGGHGEIWIRSHRVMRYTNHAAVSPSYTADGWYRSGDLGWLDERGHLTISGRMHRIISRGGEKIAPADIEHALLAHPDIEEAMVLGVPDELYGEQICACIVPRSGSPLREADVRSFLQPRISAFKIPQHIFLLPGLPLAATGKIAVADIRRLAEERLEAVLQPI